MDRFENSPTDAAGATGDADQTGSTRGANSGLLNDWNSRFVALVFAAFALSAVIYQVTPSDGEILWAVTLVLVGCGLLLASFQLSIGILRGDSRGHRSLRAGLTSGGVIALTVAVGLLVTPSDGAPWQISMGLAVFGAGVVVPMIVRLAKSRS
jgi:VIT1/CCC1 family predicted Fe2+/Mn2+ transporter